MLITKRITGLIRALVGDRFDRSPIRTVQEITNFVRTRSAYIAQTSLFGYLKTRMGTSFRRHFEDEEFSKIIHASASKLFVSCLADLTVFTVAIIARNGNLSRAALTDMATHCFQEAFQAGMADVADPPPESEVIDSFKNRIANTDWDAMASGEAAFGGSVGDLLRFAPVVDEFKDLDREIVRNSIRFRWRDVREQIRNRTDGLAIADDWNNRSDSIPPD